MIDQSCVMSFGGFETLHCDGYFVNDPALFGQQRYVAANRVQAAGCPCPTPCGKHPADFDMLKLPFRVLVEAADPDVVNALILQDASKHES